MIDENGFPRQDCVLTTLRAHWDTSKTADGKPKGVITDVAEAIKLGRGIWQSLKSRAGKSGSPVTTVDFKAMMKAVFQDVDAKKGSGPPLSDEDIQFLFEQAFPPVKVLHAPATSMSLAQRVRLQEDFQLLLNYFPRTPLSDGTVGVSVADVAEWCADMKLMSYEDAAEAFGGMDLTQDGMVEENDFVDFMGRIVIVKHCRMSY